MSNKIERSTLFSQCTRIDLLSFSYYKFYKLIYHVILELTLGFRRLSSDDDAHCINTYASIHFSSSFTRIINILPETNSFPLLVVKQNKMYTSR